MRALKVRFECFIGWTRVLESIEARPVIEMTTAAMHGRSVILLRLQLFDQPVNQIDLEMSN